MLSHINNRSNLKIGGVLSPFRLYHRTPMQKELRLSDLNSSTSTFSTELPPVGKMTSYCTYY